MEDIYEKKKQPKVQVACTGETEKKFDDLMGKFKQEGEKAEITLMRIMDAAEAHIVEAKHPELKPALAAARGTIDTLVEQINGIVAGQDSKISSLDEKLAMAIEEKRDALEAAKYDKDAAAEREKAADEAIKKAKEDIQIAQTKAQEEIEKANNERDQALRERDDARTIAEEKTASNDLLMRQMTSMEESVEDFKTLQKAYSELQIDCTSLQESSKEAARKAAEDLRDAQRETTLLIDENEKMKKSLEEMRIENNILADRNSHMQAQINDLNQQIIKAAGDAELAAERAVIAKEREMQKELRALDRENAMLQTRIDQLEAQFAEALTKNEKDKK